MMARVPSEQCRGDLAFPGSCQDQGRKCLAGPTPAVGKSTWNGRIPNPGLVNQAIAGDLCAHSFSHVRPTGESFVHTVHAVS